MTDHRPTRMAVLVALAAILSGLVCPVRAFELVVSPPRLELAVKPGRTAQGTILVGGVFDQPIGITASVGDWTLQPDGDLVFLDAGRQPRSLAKWLTIAPAEFLLGRGRQQAVRYRLQVPAGVTGSYWSVLFFQTGPLDKVREGAVGIRTAARLAVLVYASTARGGVRDGRVTGVSAKHLPGRGIALSAAFTNLGNLIFSLTGRFELKDQRTSKVLAKVPVGPLTVLPGTTREIAANWQGGLPAGDYTPFLYIDSGGWGKQWGQGPVLRIAR